jgi:hypothetical protein
VEMNNDNDLKILESEYLNGKNPINIIIAFATAHMTKRPQPQWVEDQIAKVFTEYVVNFIADKREKLSLDKLFGLKRGRGRSSPAIERFWLNRRDYDLMESIFRLRTFFKKKMTIDDTAEIVYAYYSVPKNRPHAWPPIQLPGKLAQTYKAMKWKDRFQDNHYKSGSNYRLAVKLLKYAPSEIRKKYESIMNHLNRSLPGIDE